MTEREALNSAEVREVTLIAETEVRRYFDHYLENVWPQQQRAINERIDSKIALHNASGEAHGSVEIRLSRLIWVVLGASVVGGFSVEGLSRLLHLIG